MNIAIIGATGGSGLHLCRLSLQAGHTVRVLVRSPEKLGALQSQLDVRRADARDLPSLLAALDPEVDVVVTIVGASGLLEARKVRDLYSVTARNLDSAMDSYGIRRLVAVSSGGVEPQPNDHWAYTKLLKPLFLQPMYDDMLRMEEAIKASNLEFTIVRAPYLTKGGPDGEYRTQVGRPFQDDDSLSRGNLAHALLQAVESDGLARETVWVSK